MNLPKKWKKSTKNKNVKEAVFFNIFSEKPENTIVLKMAKIPQTKKC